MATDDLRVVLRTVLEGHTPLSVDYGRLVHCKCMRFGTRSWDEYREHVAREQVQAVLISTWYAEYARMVAERVWDECKDTIARAFLSAASDSFDMREAVSNPYKEGS